MRKNQGDNKLKLFLSKSYGAAKTLSEQRSQQEEWRRYKEKQEGQESDTPCGHDWDKAAAPRAAWFLMPP